IKTQCPHFRNLVIGRQNAGKTKIHKKICDSDGSDLRIVDGNGKKVSVQILPTSRRNSIIISRWMCPSWNQIREMSDIENKITFGSSPLFVFHDSWGIEAGAEHD
ncbi:hypothetical protein B0H14DRAFT_2404024, partial [Mycena olivaceomarginata]